MGKTRTPQFEHYAKIKMVQVLGSPLYICGVITGYDGCRLKFQTDSQYTRDRFGSETLTVTLHHVIFNRVSLSRVIHRHTTPCNGVVTHRAQIGGIQVFANHTCRNKHKQNVSTIFACRVAFHIFEFSSLDSSTYILDESRLF